MSAVFGAAVEREMALCLVDALFSNAGISKVSHDTIRRRIESAKVEVTVETEEKASGLELWASKKTDGLAMEVASRVLFAVVMGGGGGDHAVVYRAATRVALRIALAALGCARNVMPAAERMCAASILSQATGGSDKPGSAINAASPPASSSSNERRTRSRWRRLKKGIAMQFGAVAGVGASLVPGLFALFATGGAAAPVAIAALFGGVGARRGRRIAGRLTDGVSVFELVPIAPRGKAKATAKTTTTIVGDFDEENVEGKDQEEMEEMEEEDTRLAVLLTVPGLVGDPRVDARFNRDDIVALDRVAADAEEEWEHGTELPTTGNESNNDGENDVESNNDSNDNDDCNDGEECNNDTAVSDWTAAVAVGKEENDPSLTQEDACTHARFRLEYEPRELRDLYVAVARYYREKLKRAGKLAAGLVAGTVLSAAVFPSVPLFLTGCAVLGSPFRVALARAEKSGLLLADSIESGFAGNRPLTIVSAGVGGLTVVTACETIIERSEKKNRDNKGRKGKGIANLNLDDDDEDAAGASLLGDRVESLVFLGVPCPVDSPFWGSVRARVSGRVVNVFSRNDWISRFKFRAKFSPRGRVGKGSSRLAACAAVLSVPGVENFDASAFVSTHLDWQNPEVVRKICDAIDLEGMRDDQPGQCDVRIISEHGALVGGK